MLKVSVLTIVFVILLAANGLFIFQMMRSDTVDGNQTVDAREITKNTRAYLFPVSEANYFPILNPDIPRPSIDARSAGVFDLSGSRFLFERNTKMRLPIASITKIMTAVVVLDLFEPDEIVTVGSASLRVDELKQDLYLNEQLFVGDLVKMMLVGSSNDAAYALTAHAQEQSVDIVFEMNRTALRFGMEDTQFLDSAGLDDDAYSTVYDLMKLLRATLGRNDIWPVLVEPEIVIMSVDKKIEHRVKNTDQLLGVIPHIIGGKTGYTDGALGCLVLLVRIPEYNDTIISVVLGSRDRFGDMQKMVDWVQNSYRWE